MQLAELTSLELLSLARRGSRCLQRQRDDLVSETIGDGQNEKQLSSYLDIHWMPHLSSNNPPVVYRRVTTKFFPPPKESLRATRAVVRVLPL